MTNTTNETLALVKTAQQSPDADLAKSFTQSASATSGLTAYDLTAPAKLLYPVNTPLRNMIARVTGGRGTQANWRAVTGINTGLMNSGVSEGNRSGITAHTTADYLAAFKGLGQEDYVTFEAGYAAEGFDDVRARAVEGLLRSTMIGEESVILGGNGSAVTLGTTPTPSLTGSASGGTLGTLTLSVICVALGYDAYWSLGGYNNGFVGTSINVATALVPGQVTRTNADGSTDVINGGAGQKSTNATASITGNTGSCAATVTAVPGAYAYAWFWGTAGSELLGAITTINSVSITATATGVQTAASLVAADYSKNGLVFDGLLSQIAKAGSGAYYKALATGTAGVGSTLTADGAGGIVEIENALGAFYDQYRLSPDIIFVNRQQLKDITAKIIAGGAAPLFRFNIDGNNPGKVNAGTVVDNYLNKTTGDEIKIMVHPTMPVGTMMFYSSQIPYKLSNVNNVVQMLMRQDYYQVEWPRRSRKYEYGVYMDGVLQNFFPPAFGVITNIANG